MSSINSSVQNIDPLGIFKDFVNNPQNAKIGRFKAIVLENDTLKINKSDWSGQISECRNKNNQNFNNEIRNAFINALKADYGVTNINALPNQVLKALKIGKDYNDNGESIKGCPLTAYRIRTVLEAYSKANQIIKDLNKDIDNTYAKIDIYFNLPDSQNKSGNNIELQNINTNQKPIYTNKNFDKKLISSFKETLVRIKNNINDKIIIKGKADANEVEEQRTRLYEQLCIYANIVDSIKKHIKDTYTISKDDHDNYHNAQREEHPEKYTDDKIPVVTDKEVYKWKFGNDALIQFENVPKFCQVLDDQSNKIKNNLLVQKQQFHY